jgi:autotransporter translocation and assembly factor TamB
MTIAGIVVLAIPTVALAAVTALVIYARSDAGRERLRQLVLEQARASVPGLEIGHIGGNYTRDLTLEAVTIRDRQGRPAVHVDRIQARFSLVPLLRKRMHVRELIVAGPRILGRPTGNGTLNLAELTAPGKETQQPGQKSSGAPLRVQVDRLAITRGSADVETPAGQSIVVDSLELHGRLALAGTAVTGELDPLAATAAVDGDRYRVELRGRAALSEAEVHAVIDRLVVGGVAPRGDIVVRGAAGGPRQDVGFHLEVGLPPAGSLTAHGRVGLVPAGLGTYAVDVRAAGVDPRALVATAPPGDLSVTVRARGTGTPLAPSSRATLALAMPPSRIADFQLREVKVDASADGQAWKIARALVRGAGAELDVRGQGRGNEVAARLRATVGDPADGRLPIRDFRGQGVLTAEVRGTLPDDVRFAATARGKKLALGQARLASVTMRASGVADRAAGTMSLAARARVAGIVAGAARVRSSTLTIDAAGPFRAPHGKVELVAGGVRPGATAPSLDDVRIDLASDGRNVRLAGRALGPGGRGGIAAHGVVTPRDARVTLDRFSIDLRSPKLEQAIALLQPVTVHWRADDVVELGDMKVQARGDRFAGHFKLAGMYRLDPGARLEPRATVALSLRKAVVNGFDAMDADGWAKLGRHKLQAGLDASVARAKLQLSADVPLIPARHGGAPRLAKNGALAVQVKTSHIKLQELPVLHKQLARRGLSGGAVDLQAAFTGEVSHPDARVTFDMREVELRTTSGDGRDAVVHRIPGVGASIKIDTQRDAIKAAGQVLLYGAGFVKFDSLLKADLGALLAGADARKAPLEVDVEIPKFQLASLKGYFDQLQDTEGVLAGKIAVRGSLSRPTGRGDLAVSNARVARLRFGPIQVTGAGDPDKITADLKLQQQQGGTLVVHANVDRTGKQPLVASVAASKLDVGFVRLFTPGVRELSGIADGSLTATGTLARPEVNGLLYYYDGRVGLVGQPTFHDLAVTVAIKPGRVDVQKVQAFSGGGALTGKGWLTLDGLRPTGLVFTANAHRFVVAAAGSTGARLDGDLAVAAELREAVVAGKVQVPRASLWLPKVGATGKKLQKIGQHEDVRFVDEAARAAAEKKRDAAAQKEPTRLDIRATAGTVYVRAKDLDIELDSNLHVTSTADGRAAMNGTVQLRRGRINIAGQRFDFDPGQIAFDGGTSPHLSIRITHQYPEALVAVEIRGTPEKPQLRLSSDPPIYDQAQIVSLVMTGQPGGQPSTGGSFDPTAVVATAVLGKLADKIAPELGLDVMRVESVEEKTEEGTATGESETRVEVGKYISERVYLSYAHVFGGTETQNRNEAHVEYRMTRRWLVETVFGDAGVGGVDALWTYRY